MEKKTDWAAYKRKQREKAKQENRPPKRVDIEFEPGTAIPVDPYPDKVALGVAEERAERARGYAERMPEHIRSGDLRYQSIEWQYEHEGLSHSRAAKKRGCAF